MFSFCKKSQVILFVVISSLICVSLLGITSPASALYFGWDYWFDANKDWGGDVNMCWAGAASNILRHRGWHTLPFSTADAIFDNFEDHWTDEGSLMHVGWEWWLNGTYPDYGPGWAYVDVPGGGDHWPAKVFANYYHEQTADNLTMSSVDAYLHAGYGVTLGIYTPSLGHALTVWGYEYNASGYQGLYVTDSDDYATQLAYYPVSYDAGNSWWELAGGYSGWHVGKVEALAPIPEPSTLFLFGSGLLGLGAYRFRRKKKV